MTADSSFTLTINDVRRCGHCVRGARRFFESYGFDFRDFLRNGIDANKFAATEDAIALDIVERAREHRNG